MDSTEIIAAIRQAAYIGDAAEFPEQTDAKLLDEANERQRVDFGKYVVQAEQGYWLTTTVQTVSTGHFRVPARSVGGGIYSVECLNSSNKYFPLEEAEPKDIYTFEQRTAAQYPTKYVFQGEDIVLVPTPVQAVTIRLRFYLRPSRIVTAQNTTSTADRGRVTSVSGSYFTVNALPYDYTITVPAAMTGSTLFDVVRPSGWHMPVAFDQTATIISGLDITPADTTILTQIAVGDYMRVANQTDWPQLPTDYHDTLASDAALQVLSDIGAVDKNKNLAPKVASEFGRFRDSLTPRSQDNAGRLKIRTFGSVSFGGR